MIKIRLPKSERGKAWRAMIEIGPIRLIAADPIYEVLPAHVELLIARGIHFEIIPKRNSPQPRRRHGKAN